MMIYLAFLLIASVWVCPAYAVGESDQPQSSISMADLAQCSKDLEDDDTVIELLIGRVFSRYAVDNSCLQNLKNLQFLRRHDLDYFQNAGVDSEFREGIDDNYFGYDSSTAINAIKSANTKASFLDQQDKGFPREKLKNYSILSGSK